jgi:hypothetical protein
MPRGHALAVLDRKRLADRTPDKLSDRRSRPIGLAPQPCAQVIIDQDLKPVSKYV